MRQRKKSSGKQKAVLFTVLVIVFSLLLWQKLKPDYIENDYSSDFVGIAEIKSELAFGVYSGEEWDDFFAQYDKNYLTGESLDAMLKKLGVSEQITGKKYRKHRVIARSEWNDVYSQIRDYLDLNRLVSEQKILILEQEAAKDGVLLLTNEGDFFTPLDGQYFKPWQAYEVYVMDGTCIGIKQVCGDELTIPNVYLKENTGEQLSFLFAGAEYQKEVSSVETDLSLGVCDVIVQDLEITALHMKQDQIEGELLSYDEENIEIRDYGKIAHPKNLPVYQTYGEITEKSISDIVLGNMNVSYITAGTEVCAILIREPAKIKDIRVLLLAEDGGNYRRDVYLRCNTPATVSWGDGNEEVEAETLLHMNDYLAAHEGKTIIVTPGEGGTLMICAEDGSAVSTPYSGTMEVRQYEQGDTLVNQLPFEQYLYAVVPSEMPSSFEKEALKAQAICARSYAYIQLLRADLAEFGAHINDSTSYQVYHKQEPTAEAIAAVEETRGKMLYFQDEVVEAYYFSTSMGYTDTAEIWNVSDIGKYGYLHKFCLNESNYDGNLSDEADFLQYIKSSQTGYDSGIKYYRWFATADLSGKTEKINTILENRHSISEENVLYYDSSEKMGDLTGISVGQRSQSGAILTLKLQYEKGAVAVKTEYNIRKILGCLVEKIVYADGSENDEVSMLPSAFCAVEKQEDGSYILHGGGYGHGLGMSQNGANGMAKAGMTCEEILQSFYQNVEIKEASE